MHKLVIMFRNPTDVLEMETKWSEAFVPVAEKMPGLKRVSVTRVIGGPMGNVDLHLIHEFYFEDVESLRMAMSSPEGQSAGQALMSFASEYATLYFAEHLEEDRA
ncbi:MAG: EthD family reductase [Anaerolineales bacterium]|nr:EthD family reductase [Anaerolineales bacterium]